MKKTSLITVVILMVLMSSASYGVTPAGPLSVSGNKIVDQNDRPISFAGMSFFWSNDGWGGSKYYNADCLNWLVSDWGVTIVRAAMGVEDGGGYLDSPTNNKNRVITLVDAAIAAGIYVIIDWHSHNAEDYQSQAVAFFEEMATTYGGYDNVIYEIYNEPLSGCSWPNDIKPYAEAVIGAIRAIDPDNLIIVGSPEWSQRVDLPAADPITGYINIAYTIHFYPDMGHTQWLRDRGTAAMNAGIALMATEWGPKGTPGHEETLAWMNWCELNYVSHTAWAVNDKDEPWSILDPWIGMETGGWTEEDLSTRGQILKDICLNWDGTSPPEPEGVNIALNQPTACSSIENASYESAYAVDGSGSTRWSSQFSDPQWIYVDLGGQKTVDSVRLNWEAAYATSYQIQVSDDASGWTDVYSTSSGDGGIDDIDLGGVVTRYVRMYGTQRATSYGYSLWEFEVYESPPVVLYQDFDYGGWSASFGPGAYTMSDIIAAGGVNDETSSLLIWPGYTVTLYEDDNFSGSSLVLTADTPNLGSYGFNDILSSMTVADGVSPVAPTNLWATAGDGTVALDWSDNCEGDLDGYNVYRSTTSGSGYAQLNGLLLSTSDYIDNSVTNGTTYYYVVTAVDTSSNESAYSNEDLATPNTGGTEGVYQEADGKCTMEAENAAVDQRSDDITWVSVTGHTGYIGSSYMTAPDNTGSSVVWSTGCELAWDVEISTAGVYYMAVRRIAADDGDDSARVGVNGLERDDNTFNGEATSWQWSRGTDFDLGNLSAGTHTIQIRRREDGFCIDRVMIADSWSKLPADGSTEAGAPENPTGSQPPDITPPAPPTGLAATAGDSTVSLDWNDNTEPDFDVYDVYRSTSAGGPYSVIDFDLTSSDYIDNTVTNGTTYYYVVTAIDTSLNESGYSNEDSATPTAAGDGDGYHEVGGVCTMEAEHAIVDQSADNINWTLATSESGYVGSGYMTAPDNTGTTVTWSTGCELAWDVYISTPGTYYMAVRRIALDNGDDSATAGINGVQRDDKTFTGEATSWKWSRGDDFDLGSLSAGTHIIQIRRREDGFCIDRVMIADSWSKLPADGSTENGPSESSGGPTVVFSDSFENGQWNGLWTEDSQNDWKDSDQRAVDGSKSAEVDGSASDAALISGTIDLQGKTNATVTFSWYIESGLDSGEYLAFDVSTNGGSDWVQKAILQGNVDPEDTWHHPSVTVTDISGAFRIRFRGKMSKSSEDADVDMVRVLAW